MSTINDGGPAFPSGVTFGENGAFIYAPQPGMTLREWFAGQALAGMMADPNVEGSHAQIADCCYAYADAMIVARKRREQ